MRSNTRPRPTNKQAAPHTWANWSRLARPANVGPTRVDFTAERALTTAAAAAAAAAAASAAAGRLAGSDRRGRDAGGRRAAGKKDDGGAAAVTNWSAGTTEQLRERERERERRTAAN